MTDHNDKGVTWVSVPDAVYARLSERGKGFVSREAVDEVMRALGTLSFPHAAVLAREGWKLVPIEPTPEMLLAGGNATVPDGDGLYCPFRADEVGIAYCAMVSAAPAAPVAEAEPIPMLLFCPVCGAQHVDAPEVEPAQLISGGPNAGRVVPWKVTWANPPHRSHLCHACGIVWRPADVATVGVEAIETSGKADTWTKETPWIGHSRPAAQAVAADEAPLDEDRIDWIANAHCPGGTAYPVNVKNAIREALREARAAVSPATADKVPATEEESHDDELAREEAYFRRWPDNGALHAEKTATADERAALMFEEWRNTYADAMSASDAALAWQAARASQAAAPAEAREPVLYQSRVRQNDEKCPWTKWDNCSKEAAQEYRKSYGGEIEIRELFDYPVGATAEAREPIYQCRLINTPAWIDASRTEFEACATNPARFETRTLSRVPADAGEAVAPCADLIARCIELRELSDHGESDQTALRALADTYRRDIHSVDRKAMAVSHTHREAVQYVLDAARAQGAQGGKGGKA